MTFDYNTATLDEILNFVQLGFSSLNPQRNLHNS